MIAVVARRLPGGVALLGGGCLTRFSPKQERVDPKAANNPDLHLNRATVSQWGAGKGGGGVAKGGGYRHGERQPRQPIGSHPWGHCSQSALSCSSSNTRSASGRRWMG